MEKFLTTYYADISQFINDPSLIAARLGEVDEGRRDRIARARFDDTKAEILCGGLMIKKALFDACGIADPVIMKNEFGKPYLSDRHDVFFNISHSGSVVLCSVSDVECGVDVEDLSAEHPIMELSSRFLSDLESAAVMMSADPNRAFCRLWTLRESYVKMRGRGFDIGLSTLKCDFHRGAASISENGVVQSDAHFRELYGIIGYQASVCTAEERENRVKKIEL